MYFWKKSGFCDCHKRRRCNRQTFEITNGKGVNVVFDPVGRKEAAKIINAMAQDGRYIIYGALSHDDIAVPVFPILGKHLTVRGMNSLKLPPYLKNWHKPKPLSMTVWQAVSYALKLTKSLPLMKWLKLTNIWQAISRLVRLWLRFDDLKAPLL